MTSDWDKDNGLVPGGSPLRFDDYQQKAASTAIYDRRLAVLYPVLGLGGEAGEVVDKLVQALFPEGPPKGWDAVTMGLKKVYWALRGAADACGKLEEAKKELRDGKQRLPDDLYEALQRRVDAMTYEQRAGLFKENFDVQWYVSAVATDMGRPLSEGAQTNLDKLAARKATNTIGGSGDERELVAKS